MRIGFDAKRLFNNKTGLGNYARNLINAIENKHHNHQIFLFTTSRKLPIQLSAKTTIIEPNGFFSILFKNLWRIFTVAALCKKHHIQLFHGLSNELPCCLNAKGIRSVVTIHDLIFIRYPQYYSFFDRLIYQFKTKRACSVAHKIVCVSNQTKQDLINFYRVEPNKIRVIPLGCEADFKKNYSIDELNNICDKYKLHNPFFISVGTVEPRKNQYRLVQAFEKIKTEQTELILVGNDTSAYAKKIKQYVAKNKLNVRFLQVGSNSHLACLYKLSLALVYVSEFEGFGIPLVEAMYCKTPIITSNISSMPEVCGNAAFYVNPLNIEEIAQAMSTIKNNKNLASELVAKGVEQARLFDYNSIADKYLELYDEVLKG